MKPNAGYIVKTKTGLSGRTKHSDKRVNGKVIVYLEDEHGKPVLEKGVQKKLLCDAGKLELLGFTD